MESVEQIREKLQRALEPEHVEVFDESRAHVGHHAGGGHFKVLIVSRAFGGKTSVERHRMVFRTVGMGAVSGVHALVIEAWTPDEWKRRAQ